MARVAFIHPDLGIGGAERLVVDAALALKSKGHSVELYTAHHDPKHCFQETRDGTLSVITAGDWLPRHFCHKCYAFFAYLRMLYIALYVILFAEKRFDVIICDQISACLPILRLFSHRSKVIFFCHFPDQLLTHRKTLLKRLYRWPLDKLEEWTTGLAHKILVNSHFTSKVFHQTFKSLSEITPTVLYPSLNFSNFDIDLSSQPDLSFLPSEDVKVTFLSINRYERKKNISLALNSFANLLRLLKEKERSSVHLVISGGYDDRVVENKEYYTELKALADKYEITSQVTFIRSFTDMEKVQLLSQCSVLLYTPSNEHFGICPLEAMYMSRPVIAVSSGGPLETVLDGQTGYLCEPSVEGFSDKMLHYVRNPKTIKSHGFKGREQVIANFSFDSFTAKLDSIVKELI